MSTQVILLERVEKLGEMGDIVSVRPGYARNFLLPQSKALRASKDNIAYFEAQKKHLQAENDKKKAEAEKLAKKIDGVKVALIRQASEGGQLFGSVNARDIADQASNETGLTIDRTMVQMNQNFKMIGLFPVAIVLHPEVKATITINIARSAEEAKTQADSGRALIAGAAQEADAQEADLSGVLEDSALEAEKEKKAKAEADAADEAVDAEKAAAKKAKKAEKAKSKASDEVEDDAEGENLPDED